MRSIRTRLLLSLLAMLAVAAAAIGAISYRNVLAETESLFDYQLRQMALSLRDQGEISPDQAEVFADPQLDVVVQIWTVDGRSIYASRPHPELPARALLGFADVAAGGRTWRTFSVATRTRVIQVAQPVEIRRELAAGAALRTVAPLLVVAPLLLLLTWWLVRRELAPLARVAEELRRRGDGALEPLPDAALPDELAPLAASLNGLLARLGSALDTQRAFVADAAHELRSPLTALKLQLQLLRRAADAPAREEATASLAAGIERATRLVEQLLALARHEPGVPLEAESLDLADVAREAAAGCEAYARQRGSAVTVIAPEPVTMVGDRPALVVMLRNLIDNALRYSPEGQRVEVRATHARAVPLLQVDDPGPGIPPAERERAFDRFRRGGASDEPGSGLGLAIVRSIAQRHRATIALGESPLGGLRATVAFPAGENAHARARRPKELPA